MEHVQLRAKDSAETALRGFYALTIDSRPVPILKIGAWLLRGVGFFFIVVAIFLLLFEPKNARPELSPIGRSLPVVCVSFAFLFAPSMGKGYLRRSTGRALKKRDAKLVAAEFTLTAETFHHHTALSDVECKWQLCPLAVENQFGLLITVRPDAGYWLDATWFHTQAEADQVTAWARAGAKKYKMIRPIEIPPFKDPVDDFIHNEI